MCELCNKPMTEDEFYAEQEALAERGLTIGHLHCPECPGNPRREVVKQTVGNRADPTQVSWLECGHFVV